MKYLKLYEDFMEGESLPDIDISKDSKFSGKNRIILIGPDSKEYVRELEELNAKYRSRVSKTGRSVYEGITEKASKEKDSDVKLYHGNRKGDFPPERKRFAGAIFLTSNLDFAKDFAGFDDRDNFPNGAVWQVKLKPDVKICNPSNPDIIKELDIKTIIQKMVDEDYTDEVNRTKFSKVGKGFKGFDFDTNQEFDIEDGSQSVYFYLWRIKNGAWRIIECEPIISAIKSKGYDGFEITERGSKNVAIFDESLIEKFEKIL